MNPYETSGISDVFIMRETGECVFHQSYEDKNKLNADGTLISSFLSTIEAFSSNVDVGAKMLETTNYRFVYHRRDDFIYVARTEKSVNPEYVSSALNNVSEEVTKVLPEKWDGNVDRFRNVTTLLETQFNKNQLNQYYEITGRAMNKLDGIEAKIYSFLRFKGRASLSSISRLMKIPEDEVVQVTSKLVENRYLEACS